MKAFPNLQLTVSEMGQVRAINEINTGMDLRDYFAAQAMQGMLSNPEFLQVVTKEEVNGSDCASRVAKVSYKYADAMMEARDK
jgi:hypothetical protein